MYNFLFRGRKWDICKTTKEVTANKCYLKCLFEIKKIVGGKRPTITQYKSTLEHPTAKENIGGKFATLDIKEHSIRSGHLEFW